MVPVQISSIFAHTYTEDMEKSMATHSSTLALKVPWTEEPGRLQSMGSLRVGHDWVTSLSLFTFMHWRRQWQPLQCSCLENPRDGGAWWAAVYGVAQSQTRLKRLSSSILKTKCYFYEFYFLSYLTVNSKSSKSLKITHAHKRGQVTITSAWGYLPPETSDGYTVGRPFTSMNVILSLF